MPGLEFDATQSSENVTGPQESAGQQHNDELIQKAGSIAIILSQEAEQIDSVLTGPTGSGKSTFWERAIRDFLGSGRIKYISDFNPIKRVHVELHDGDIYGAASDHYHPWCHPDNFGGRVLSHIHPNLSNSYHIIEDHNGTRHVIDIDEISEEHRLSMYTYYGSQVERRFPMLPLTVTNQDIIRQVLGLVFADMVNPKNHNYPAITELASGSNLVAPNHPAFGIHYDADAMQEAIGPYREGLKRRISHVYYMETEPDLRQQFNDNRPDARPPTLHKIMGGDTKQGMRTVFPWAEFHVIENGGTLEAFINDAVRNLVWSNTVTPKLLKAILKELPSHKDPEQILRRLPPEVQQKERNRYVQRSIGEHWGH